MTKEEILESKTMLEVVNQCGLTPNRSGFIHCPFHDGDSHASLKLYPKSFYCFGCGKGGDVFTFVELYEHCDFHTAFIRLGGTDRTGKRTNEERFDAYRARKAAETRKRQEERRKRQIIEIGKELDFYRERMEKAEPLSDEWQAAHDKWLLACQKQEALMDEGRR